jgi:basic amino acid/polyamine antiporter, APA family
VLVLCDGLVWSELGAAMPGSGGSYRYLREAYGPNGWGRLMAFLFIWQFLLSGPLEIATGLIGFGNYSAFLVPGLGAIGKKLVAAGVGVVAVLALSRRITSLGRITVTLWIGTLATMAAILIAGAPHVTGEDLAAPFRGLELGGGFLLGLGSATMVTTYCYLGYYDVCYIGDEVRDPARVIPRSILGSIAFCAVAYLAIHVVLVAVLGWRDAMHSGSLVSDFMRRLHGPWAAGVVTVAVLWTAFGSVFALLLGYSRIPYAAARDGTFFRRFGDVHPTRGFPHVSLYALGAASIVAAFLPLDDVLVALMTTRVLVQFGGQILAVPLMRRRLPEAARPYRMPLYPLPLIVALAGWGYIFATAGWIYVAVGLATLVAGIGAYALWARAARGGPATPA